MKLLTAYIIATFLLAIPYTVAQANRDNAESTRQTGKVNLLRSYWYESYTVRDVFQWLHGADPNMVVIPLVCDKAAVKVYAREYGVTLMGQAKLPAIVLTAYPRILIPPAGSYPIQIHRLYPPKPNFMCVYEVTP